jgi:tetratricopeptide (TPR) repeat protein
LADSVADAYVKVGKFDRAFVLYDYALKIRTSGGVEDHASFGKSYDRLAKFYRAQSDYSHAAEYYEKLIEFYRVNPRRGDYVAAMLSLASIKAEDPNASREAAVSLYLSAATIAEKRSDWSTEDIVHYRLAKLYEKRNQPTEQALALGKRVSALQKYIDELVARKPMEAKQAGKLVSEYLQAVNVLAYFHTGKNNDKAADAYQLAFNARGYITDNIQDETLLKFYAALLADYQTLLNRINRKPLAADVGRVAQGLRESLTKAEGRKLTTESRSASAY